MINVKAGIAEIITLDVFLLFGFIRKTSHSHFATNSLTHNSCVWSRIYSENPTRISYFANEFCIWDYYVTGKMSSKSGSYPEENAARGQIQQDWANREYVEVITTSIKRITDFLNSFGRRNQTASRFSLIGVDGRSMKCSFGIDLTTGRCSSVYLRHGGKRNCVTRLILFS